MVQYSSAALDISFAALSDATRRGVLEQLGRTDASITDLAQTFHMTLTGMRKHVGVLEQAGLVTTEKVGRVRTCRLGPRRLEEETAWLEQIPPALGRTLRRVGQGRRGTATEGEGRWTQERDSEPAPITEYARRWNGSPSVSSSFHERSTGRRDSCLRPGPSPAVQALVGAEVVSHLAAVLRDGCSRRGQIPPGVRLPGLHHGVLRAVPRGDPALAPGVDERRRR